MSSSSYLRIVERDPTGRYVRYTEKLGVGSWKIVYKGFDQVNGIEIAWSRIVITRRMSKCLKDIDNLCEEVCLLKCLEHENIVKCYHSWIDYRTKTIHMITELFTSTNLGHLIDKHKIVGNTAIKNWCIQILKGLAYLHSCNPPVIHRDLKSLNIFINGNSGVVKIGDLGLAVLLKPGSGVSGSVGTPEYMAPEIFRGNYNELVDIHSFGICVLEMVTREPNLYAECRRMEEIVEKVKAGIKPISLSRVTHPLIKNFIERCLAPAYMRPSANDLLNDPFLAPTTAGTSTIRTNLTLSLTQIHIQSEGSPFSITRNQVDRLLNPDLVMETYCDNKKLKLQGRIKDNGIIKMAFSITNDEQLKQVRNFEFEFSVETDKPYEYVVENIAIPLMLSTQGVKVATEIMIQLIAELQGETVTNTSKSSPSDEFFDAHQSPSHQNNKMPSCFAKMMASARRKF
ncbi:probable serine/threonine-protein kinase WNK11 [Spinacia oleracea]|uniref:non-specific serine/threonine protein kinase n=1 Tax=Spinacia oleracea TaxID=3562 RepID=A0A9R0IK52_SPIOL|nr:probable serine/threonine-protein kinase WNK11 [Spinacia oleracea]